METETFTAVIMLPWRLTHSLPWLRYHGDWHIHCSDYSTKEATERYKIQSEGSTVRWQTLTTASVAVELWARVCMTSSGGSKLRLSICNDDVKLITHTAVEYTVHNHDMHQRWLEAMLMTYINLHYLATDALHQRLIDWVGFNVPLNTLYVISGTGFTGQMTQPTVSKHWRK